MAYQPSAKRKREEENLELNILPLMNLIIVLIPLLLSRAQFTKFALLEYLPPAEAAVTEGAPPGENRGIGGTEQGTLNLLVNLTETGLQVSVYQNVTLGPNFFEIPKENDKYNWKALKDSLWTIKLREVGDPIGSESVLDEKTGEMKEKPKYRVKDAEEVSIAADGATPFQTIIELMDACQTFSVNGELHPLFPVTLLKQFQ